ncbi:aminoglycoside phosphotransferase [Nocardia panacis]|uniref:Aminoglycoside phosphotransferase n=1 Tax=Nocardia panacis TaxID=2340916 RepID=A0A3A4K0V5_9NOCA|nr:phosphotransferase [Nocardia panacis]RJO73330.1 aminoglycoside phosphotransferase [Nocardia panacis]
MTHAPLDPTAARLAADLGVDVTIDRILRATDKSLLVEGDYRGRRAVIKACRTDEPFWRDKITHEIGIYRAFTACPPPVRVPELIHAETGVMVLEYIPGQVVDTERYPTRPLDPTALNTILTTVVNFGTWNPPPKTLAPVFDYPDRVRRYHRAGFFDDHDRAALHRLIDAAGPFDAVAHGDPLPGNLLLAAPGDCVPLDFEFTGLFAAGFDLAMLHTLLGATPGLQAGIEAIVARSGIEAPFLLNQAVVLSREVRVHTELAAGEFRERRLALLRPQWNAMLDQLHDR